MRSAIMANLAKTQSTITFPLFKLVSKPDQDNPQHFLAFHEKTEELITLCIGHIQEIRISHRKSQQMKTAEGKPATSLPEITISVKTLNSTFMVFAEHFIDDNSIHVEQQAERVHNFFTDAMDEYNRSSNPFQRLNNLIDERFNNLMDTIEY